jgi:hypothetical protein
MVFVLFPAVLVAMYYLLCFSAQYGSILVFQTINS